MAVVRPVNARPKGVTLSCWVPGDLAAQIDAIAARTGRTRSQTALELLRFAVKKDAEEGSE